MVETLRQKSKLLATFISWFALSCKCWWLVFRRRSRDRFCENKSTEILFWLPIAGTHTTWPASQFWSSDVSHMLILTSNKQGVYRGGLVLTKNSKISLIPLHYFFVNQNHILDRIIFFKYLALVYLSFRLMISNFIQYSNPPSN